MRTLRRSGGFTLIELPVVIAMIAIIAAICIPNLIEARKGSNEAAAIGALRTIAKAQTAYEQHHGVPASNLAQLVKDGLLDPPLAVQTVKGYIFVILPPSLPAANRFGKWTALAVPASPGRSGDGSFFVDESGVIRFSDCPPGTLRLVPGGTCEPHGESPQTSPIGGLDMAAITGIEAVDQFARGAALAGARFLVGMDTFRLNVLSRLDANGDGRLTFSEILSADVLGIARSLPGTIQVISQTSSPPIGDDAELTAVIQTYLERLAGALALGPDEELPAVQRDGATGFPGAFMEMVAAAGPRASLEVLRALYEDLPLDRERQETLERIDDLLKALRNGQVRRVRNGLLALRMPAPTLEIAAQIDVILKQLPPN